MPPGLQTEFAQLAIWTKKFNQPFSALKDSQIQKITASLNNEMILTVFKPSKKEKSTIVLSMNKADCGIYTATTKPQSLPKPNSIVEITRKYLHNSYVAHVYATFSPICVVIECHPKKIKTEDDEDLLEGPDTLILNLDSFPPKIVLAKKHLNVPERYEKECSAFAKEDLFFESWCEWSSEITKTKRRVFYEKPLIGYCPVILENPLTVQPLEQTNDAHFKQPKESDNLIFNQQQSQWVLFPTHIRRAIRTKLLFLERRLSRQKTDLPSSKEIDRLKKQSEGLKSSLYLWPKDSLIWYVPPALIEQYHLNSTYRLKKGEKQGNILETLHKEIDILTRREQELQTRIQENQKNFEEYNAFIVSVFEEIKDAVDDFSNKNNLKYHELNKKHLSHITQTYELSKLHQLCKNLNVPLQENKKETLKRNEERARLPYRTFNSTLGEEIRVSKSAGDADEMIRLMPSNHFWLHVLEGEGSHVWVKKHKQQNELPEQTLQEAGMLALHYSKQSKNMMGYVQLAFRSDIEKKKNLPPGKVLVRRSETLKIKYDRNDLKNLLEKG